MKRRDSSAWRLDRFEALMGLVALSAWAYLLASNYPALLWPSALAWVTAAGAVVVVGRRILLGRRPRSQAVRR